jgi:lipid A disaccharide synthetase
MWFRPSALKKQSKQSIVKFSSDLKLLCCGTLVCHFMVAGVPLIFIGNYIEITVDCINVIMSY